MLIEWPSDATCYKRHRVTISYGLVTAHEIQSVDQEANKAERGGVGQADGGGQSSSVTLRVSD